MLRAALQLLVRLIVAPVLACWLGGPAAAQDQHDQASPNSRVALVIGNSAYQHAVPLETATKDAAAMADALTRLGFAVNSLTDADYEQTRKALLGFAQSARQSSMAIIYFAGYGIQAKGEDYLMPVEADLQSDVEIGATALHALMSAVGGAKDLGLVMLEAGRGSPFVAAASRSSTATRGIEPGLAAVEPAEDNILVAFAARPGTTAVDRAGPHSPFTEALLNNIETPGLEIQYLFRNVEADVRDATDQEQEAAHYGSLSDKEIFLKPADVATGSMELAGTGEPASAATGSEEIAWFFLRDSTDIRSLRQFVERFPNGEHRAQASELIAHLEQAAQTPPAASAPSAEEIAWSIVSERPTAVGLQRFINAYRDGPHAQDALALLTNIAQAKQQHDAQRQQTEKSSSGSRPAVARPAEKKLIVQRISRNNSNVEGAWQLVRTSRDPVVLRKFAADFPSRRYVSATDKRLAELGFDSRRPANLSPREAAEYSLTQCDRLAAGDFARVSRDAVDACRQALAAHPDFPRLQFQLCQCLIKDGRHQEATEHCGAAVQMAEAKGDVQLANQYRATQTALLVTDGGSSSAIAGGASSGVGPATGGGASPTVAATSPSASASVPTTTTTTTTTTATPGGGAANPTNAMQPVSTDSAAGAHPNSLSDSHIRQHNAPHAHTSMPKAKGLPAAVLPSTMKVTSVGSGQVSGPAPTVHLHHTGHFRVTNLPSAQVKVSTPTPQVHVHVHVHTPGVHVKPPTVRVPNVRPPNLPTIRIH